MIFGQESTEIISRKRAINCKNTWQYYRIQLLEIKSGLLRDRKQSGSYFFHFSLPLSLSLPPSLSLSVSLIMVPCLIPSMCLFCSPGSPSYLSLYIWQIYPPTQNLWGLYLQSPSPCN